MGSPPGGGPLLTRILPYDGVFLHLFLQPPLHSFFQMYLQGYAEFSEDGPRGADA